MTNVKFTSIFTYDATFDETPEVIKQAIASGNLAELEPNDYLIDWASEKPISAQIGDGEIEDLGGSSNVAYHIYQIGPALDQLWNDFEDQITAYVVDKAGRNTVRKMAKENSMFIADDVDDAINNLAYEHMFMIPDPANDSKAGNLYRDEAIELADRIARREGWNAVHALLLPGDTMAVGHDPRIFRKNLAWHEKVAVATEKLRVEMCDFIKNAAPFNFPEDTDIRIDGIYLPTELNRGTLVCTTLDGYPVEPIDVDYLLDLNCLSEICDLIQEQKDGIL